MGKASSGIFFRAACTFSLNPYRQKRCFVIWGLSLCDPHLPLGSSLDSLLLYFHLQRLKRYMGPRAEPLISLSVRVYSWPPRRGMQGVPLLSSVRAGTSCHVPLSALLAPFGMVVHQRRSHFFPETSEEVSWDQERQ